MDPSPSQPNLSLSSQDTTIRAAASNFSTDVQRGDTAHVEISVSPSSPVHQSTHNRKEGSIENSLDHHDKRLKTALLSWLNKMCAAQEQSTRAPEGSSRVREASNVKITVQVSAPRRTRTSRYLCERDRWEIIKRIDDGEQQVTLANEFRVSRAAICNLYKNRQEILARSVNDPKTTHPKKSHKINACNKSSLTPSTAPTRVVDLTTTTTTPTLDHDENSTPVDHSEAPRWWSSYDVTSISENEATVSSPHQNEANQEARAQRGPIQQMMENLAVSTELSVHEAAEHSYTCRDLVAAIRDESISTDMFQQRVTRLMRFLIEEALTCLPHDIADVTTPYGDICHVTKTLDERNICGISMEDRGNELLQTFSEISPTSPVGIVSVNGGDSKRVNAHLPTINPGQVVLLLDIQCAAGDESCAVIHHLVDERNVPADQVYFVTVISSFEGLQKVFRKFPGVTLITA